MFGWASPTGGHLAPARRAIEKVKETMRERAIRPLAAALCLLLVATALPVTSDVARAQPPEGAAIFQQNCAGCHDGSASSRAPTPEQLRNRSASAIVAALTGGAMRYQGLALTGAERREVAEYLAGPLNLSDSNPDAGRCLSAPAMGELRPGRDWNGWGPTLANDHARTAAAAGISADGLSGLKVKWAFGFPDATTAWSQPTIVGGRVFVGGQNGDVYALDEHSGCIIWRYTAKGGVRGSVAIGHPNLTAPLAAYFTDQMGYAYAVDAADGKEIWTTQVDNHPLVRLTGSPALYKGRLYVPTSSYEEAGKSLTYECCTFRGAVVALDAARGRVLWHAYTILEPAKLIGHRPDGGRSLGPSGGAIWSAPTIDPKRRALYVGVGNTYSGTDQPTTDAILAFDLETGRLRWSQRPSAEDDVSGCRPGEPNCGGASGPDADFGASPALVKLPNGHDILIAGQKSGVAFGLDPDSGRIRWQFRAGRGGPLGGINWDIAADDSHAYIPVADLGAGPPGGLFAVKLATGERVWTAVPPRPLLCSPSGASCSGAHSAAVTVIPGAVLSGSFDGGLRAYSTRDGSILWTFDTNGTFDTVNGVPAHGGSINGPAPVVGDGMLFVSSGDYRGRPGNVLIALGTD
jgi:polyvinyl alcohol dehydrogenase (cytochrome)